MAVSLLTYANRAKVAQALTERGYEVTRMTVNRWAAGSEMPEIAARMIAELFGHDPDTRNSPPAWAEGLVENVLEAGLAAMTMGLLSDEDAAEMRRRYDAFREAIRRQPSS